ncbi:hypothetical protein H8356DRAFT_1342918 [Neocallimastix lanati (nom. inval.)]|nr:hypothetical protein H8356DRAFT_1342918 [Neocallimastix sp. JGI-2020a]
MKVLYSLEELNKAITKLMVRKMTIKNHGSLDSGTGINLSKNIKILSNIENIKTMNDSEELDDYISKNIKDININKKHLKYDSTVRIIILNSLDEYIKGLLNNCTSAYLMINELKGRFSETGPSRLFEIEMKIKKIEIENDDFNLEETKVFYSLEKLNKVGIVFIHKHGSLDSGTGINLFKSIKILSNIEEVTNRGITYPNEQLDRIYKKDSKFIKNNKLNTTVYTNDEYPFTLNISAMKNMDFNISNVDLKLWHARLGL